MRKFSIVFCLLSMFNHINAQNYDDGFYLSKYWNYRYALRGDDIDPSYKEWEPGFLEVGGCHGCSIPMKFRSRKEQDGDKVDWCYDCENTLPINRPHYAGLASWVDAPTELGKYLVVLATELELLRKSYPSSATDFQATSNFNLYLQAYNTYHELDFAINAVERLDWFAEVTYGQNAAWNGFFIRDDVPADFGDDGKFGIAETKLQDFWNNPNQSDPYYRGNSFRTITSEEAVRHRGRAACGYQAPESQDQLIKLLLGLIYAKKYIKNFRDQFGFDTKNIYGRTHGVIDRFLWYMFPSFSINDPNGNNVCLGPSALGYSAPFWSIYNSFGDGNFNGPTSFNSTTVGIPAWEAQKTFYTSSYITTAINSWWAPYLFGSTAWANCGMIFPGQYFSHEMFGYLGAMDDRAVMYLGNSLPLFGYVVGCGGDDEIEYQVNYLLEPLRQGIYGFNQSLFPLDNYKDFMNKWNFECLHETREYTGMNYVTDKVHEKSGLNYMMAHNLYLLAKDDKAIDLANGFESTFVPMYDRKIDGTFPKSISVTRFIKMSNTFPSTPIYNTYNYNYGSTINPINIEAANSIDLSNSNLVFENNAKVKITAPRIYGVGTYNIKFGAVVDIVPQRMSCSNFTSLISSNGGSVLSSKSVKSNDVIVDPSISLYPNPTTSVSKINVKGFKNTDVLVLIYDLMGREIFRQYEEDVDTENYDISLKTNGFQDGTYIVKVKNKDVEKVARMIVLKN